MVHRDTSDIIRAAVWIRPSGAAFEQIQAAVNEVHRRGGGPRIQPHVTLLSGIETTRADAEGKLKSLATRLHPFTVRLGKLDWRHEYYRCLFAAVELSEELAAAKRWAHQIFEMNPPEPFEPHLSLMYGDPHGSLKPELAAALGNRLDVTFTATALHLVNASPSVPVPEWRTLSEHALAEFPHEASGGLAG